MLLSFLVVLPAYSTVAAHTTSAAVGQNVGSDGLPPCPHGNDCVDTDEINCCVALPIGIGSAAPSAIGRTIQTAQYFPTALPGLPERRGPPNAPPPKR